MKRRISAFTLFVITLIVFLALLFNWSCDGTLSGSPPTEAMPWPYQFMTMTVEHE